MWQMDVLVGQLFMFILQNDLAPVLVQPTLWEHPPFEISNDSNLWCWMFPSDLNVNKLGGGQGKSVGRW